MAKAVLSEWTHPRTGQVRRYVQNWEELIGFEVEFYNTGSVKNAIFNGELISNAEARRIMGTKIWVDADGAVHVDYWRGRDISAGQVADMIKKAL